MRFSSKSGQNIGIHMFSGAFLEKPVFHFRPSEASFIISLVATGGTFPVVAGERSPAASASASAEPVILVPKVGDSHEAV